MTLNILLAVILGVSIFPQEPMCKVKIPEISSAYEGQCKKRMAHGVGKASGMDTFEGQFIKGLPHGEGKYTWKNNDYYSGSFRNGKKHGYGTFFIAEQDSLFTGIWKNDAFKKRTSLPKDDGSYKVFYQRNTTRVRFTKISDAPRVFFKINEPGVERKISSTSTFGTSGYYIEYPNMFGYEEVKFPFQGKIFFQAPSRTGTVTYQVELFFEIREPGYWEVNIQF